MVSIWVLIFCTFSKLKRIISKRSKNYVEFTEMVSDRNQILEINERNQTHILAIFLFMKFRFERF